MKNLENYGVQALDAKEIKTIDGGIHPFAWMAIGYVIGAIIDGIYTGLKCDCKGAIHKPL